LQVADDDESDSINQYSPFVFLQGNRFERNMAYIQGNAVFIKGSQKFDQYAPTRRASIKKYGII
jgi:hypothetical protein